MSGNGLISQYMVGASATQTEEGPCNPKGLAPEVSQIWDELRKHIDTDAWRSSNQYLFQTLCELILQSRTLAHGAKASCLKSRRLGPNLASLNSPRTSDIATPWPSRSFPPAHHHDRSCNPKCL